MNTVVQESASTANMKAYFKTHDIKFVAEDAVFIDMATGERYTGKTEIENMLHHIYHIAFDAKATTDNYIITEDKAMIEGLFIGKHIGNFAGIEATHKDVSVPLCVTYSLEDGLIKEAKIYMPVNVMMGQLQS